PTSLPECLTSSSRRSLSQRRTPDVPMPPTPPTSSSQTPSPSLRALSRPPSAVPSIEFIPIPMIPSGYKGRTPSIGSMLNPRRGQSVDARRKGGALRGDAAAAAASSSFQGSATLSLQRGRRSVSMDARSRSR
ncbi:hypothetical protein HDU78_005574, partial [Chytriomyces hyalinus]